jgi:hypothetical protein
MSRAPKTISRTIIALPNPCKVEAGITIRSIFHTTAARIAAVNQAKGIALVAGQQKPTIRIKATRMGMKAIIPRNPTDIKIFLVLKGQTKYYVVLQMEISCFGAYID